MLPEVLSKSVKKNPKTKDQDNHESRNINQVCKKKSKLKIKTTKKVKKVVCSRVNVAKKATCSKMLRRDHLYEF